VDEAYLGGGRGPVSRYSGLVRGGKRAYWRDAGFDSISGKVVKRGERICRCEDRTQGFVMVWIRLDGRDWLGHVVNQKGKIAGLVMEQVGHKPKENIARLEQVQVLERPVVGLRSWECLSRSLPFRRRTCRCCHAGPVVGSRSTVSWT
jgi:hypothetical protein